MNLTMEKVNELENRTVGITKSEQQRESGLEKKKTKNHNKKSLGLYGTT